jgi:hypothetical protein
LIGVTDGSSDEETAVRGEVSEDLVMDLDKLVGEKETNGDLFAYCA